MGPFPPTRIPCLWLSWPHTSLPRTHHPPRVSRAAWVTDEEQWGTVTPKSLSILCRLIISLWSQPAPALCSSATEVILHPSRPVPGAKETLVSAGGDTWDGAHPSCLLRSSWSLTEETGRAERCGLLCCCGRQARAPDSISGSALSFSESLVLVLMMCPRNHGWGRVGATGEKVVLKTAPEQRCP